MADRAPSKDDEENDDRGAEEEPSSDIEEQTPEGVKAEKERARATEKKARDANALVANIQRVRPRALSKFEETTCGAIAAGTSEVSVAALQRAAKSLGLSITLPRAVRVESEASEATAKRLRKEALELPTTRRFKQRQQELLDDAAELDRERFAASRRAHAAFLIQQVWRQKNMPELVVSAKPTVEERAASLSEAASLSPGSIHRMSSAALKAVLKENGKRQTGTRQELEERVGDLVNAPMAGTSTTRVGSAKRKKKANATHLEIGGGGSGSASENEQPENGDEVADHGTTVENAILPFAPGSSSIDLGMPRLRRL